MFPKKILLLSIALLAPLCARADLTLTQAIDLAIKNNVSVRLAQAKTAEARGQALRAASDLLPQVMGSASQSRVFKQNLEAMGFEPNGAFNTLIGPYNSFDARVSLVQKIFDLSASAKSSAGKIAARAAEREEALAKEQVASAAALAYLELIRSRRAVEAAQTESDLSNSLLGLANDQHKSGLATGVDVARSQTRDAEGNLRLIRARTNQRQAGIRLARLTGLPPGEPIATADTLTYSSSTMMSVGQALAIAQKDRVEIELSNLALQSAQQSYASARRANLPSLYATGDYGLSGSTPKESKETGSIGAHLNVPIFTGKRLQGESEAASALVDQARAQYDDVRQQIDADVRIALESLTAAQDEVATADQAHAFAQREMTMARDRYAAGVGDNIQVISAQNVVAQADDDWIGAIAAYQAARINLEMAIGHAQAFTLRPS
jgi:outer membrane protein TolC